MTSDRFRHIVAITDLTTYILSEQSGDFKDPHHSKSYYRIGHDYIVKSIPQDSLPNDAILGMPFNVPSAGASVHCPLALLGFKVLNVDFRQRDGIDSTLK